MTHEFKTPLATISLAVDALKNEKVSSDKEKTNYFTGIIKEENRRMNKQVETILQAALLDKQEVQLNLKKLPAHDLVVSALNNINLQVEEKDGKLEVFYFLFFTITACGGQTTGRVRQGNDRHPCLKRCIPDRTGYGAGCRFAPDRL